MQEDDLFGLKGNMHKNQGVPKKRNSFFCSKKRKLKIHLMYIAFFLIKCYTQTTISKTSYEYKRSETP